MEDRKLPEDGTLAWVTLVPSNTKKENYSNVMLIETPEHLRTPDDPIIHLATVDRSIPGDNHSGNAILDKLYPNLPKVTLWEDVKPKPKDDTLYPRKRIQRKESVRPCRASSTGGGKTRSYFHKKPSPERSNRPNADEINPWLPGNEPYIAHGSRCMPTIPLIAKSAQTMKYHELDSRPVIDSFVPRREKHPLPQEYPHIPGSFDDGPPPNFSAGFDDGPPANYPGGFSDDPLPNYSSGFGDGPEPAFQNSTRSFRRPKFNNRVRRSFRSRNNSRGGRHSSNAYPEESRGDTNLNQRFQRESGYPNRGRSHAQRFCNTDSERSSATQRWGANEMQGPSTHNKDRGKSYGPGKRRVGYTIPQKPFNRRGKHY